MTLKLRNLLLFCLVVFVAGTVTFVEQDRSGVLRAQNLFAFHNIYRIAMFGFAGLLLGAAVITGGIKRFLSFLIEVSPIIFLFLSFALTMFVNIQFEREVGLGFQVQWAESVRSYYFLIEWFLFFLCAYYCIDMLEQSGYRLEDIYKKLIVIVATIYLSVVLVAIPISSSLAFGEFGRLGGFVVNPNKLAVVSLVAAAVLFQSDIRVNRLVIAPSFILAAILTGSRSVVLGGIIAYVLARILSSSSASQILLRLGVLTVAGLAGSLLTLVFLDQVLNFVTRGQSLEAVITLNSRVSVWLLSLDLFVSHPLTGIGYYFGPKHLWEFYNASLGLESWRAPHAHNELLNAALSGGIICAIGVLYVYIIMLVRAAKRFSGRNKFLMIFSTILLFIHSLATPVLSEKLLASGIVLTITFCVLARKSANYHVNRRQFADYAKRDQTLAV